MRLFKGVLVVAALSAVAMFGVACGETEEPPGATTCTADADCGEGEGCHPTAKVCLATCTQTSDCTDQTQANCGPVKNPDGTDSTTKFCKCSTDQLCNADDTTDLICGNISNTCSTKCAGDADCSGFGAGTTCDTATGQCKLQVIPTTCTKDADCTDTTKPFCDTTTGACVATQPIPKCNPATTTVGANGGPDICKTGEICDAATQECKAAQGSCAAATAHGDKRPATGTVIYGVVSDGTRAPGAAGTTGGDADRNACTNAGNTIQKFKGKLYDADGNVPTSGNYNNFKVVSKNGNVGSTHRIVDLNYDPATKSGTFGFELCSDTKNNIEGVYLLDTAGAESNVACFTFP